jgi:hypothetical protein
MRERKPFDPGLGASAGLSEVAQWPVPAGRLDMGAWEPQMFSRSFSQILSRLLSACAVPERPWNTAVNPACRKLLGARPVSKELVDG